MTNGHSTHSAITALSPGSQHWAISSWRDIRTERIDMMTMMTRRGLALGALPLLLGGAAAAPGSRPRTPLAAEPISRMDLRWWRERHEAKLAELKRGHVDLVFLGDSITQNWEKSGPQPWQNIRPIWNRFYGDRNALNL